jgi:hypothetical protein
MKGQHHLDRERDAVTERVQSSGKNSESLLRRGEIIKESRHIWLICALMLEILPETYLTTPPKVDSTCSYHILRVIMRKNRILQK